jgi:type IV fimbrial biogenesis protein FimT
MQPNTSIRAIRSEAGFTMIELMIVILLAAVLMAMAVPTFHSTIAGNRLTTQANDLVGAINYARSEAISHNTSATFCRANLEASTNCSGSSGNWQFWIIRNATGTVLRRGVINTYGGVLTLSSTLVNDSAAFSSDGLARSGGALITSRAITVCVNNISDNNIRTVTIGAGSRISTEKSSGGC